MRAKPAPEGDCIFASHIVRAAYMRASETVSIGQRPSMGAVSMFDRGISGVSSWLKLRRSVLGRRCADTRADHAAYQRWREQRPTHQRTDRKPCAGPDCTPGDRTLSPRITAGSQGERKKHHYDDFAFHDWNLREDPTFSHHEVMCQDSQLVY